MPKNNIFLSEMPVIMFYHSESMQYFCCVIKMDTLKKTQVVKKLIPKVFKNLFRPNFG
jgi:hypothetical protein